MKVRSRKPSAFIVFNCLETPMKPDARVFEIASQSRLRNKRCCYEKLYCDGDLSFQKRYEKCYHTAVDDYKKQV